MYSRDKIFHRLTWMHSSIQTNIKVIQIAHPSKAKTLQINSSAILMLKSIKKCGRRQNYIPFKSEKYFCSKGIESYSTANIAVKIKVSEGGNILEI